VKYHSNEDLVLELETSRLSPAVLPEPITVLSENLSLVFDTDDVLRYYGESSGAALDRELAALDCSPPTPIAQMNGFRDTANTHRNTMQNIVSSLNQNSLHMASFANALNSYISFTQTVPAEFCINAQNRPAFDEMNAAFTNANNVARQGISIFENNFGRFVQQATPLLQSIGAESRAITPASRDFRRVMSAVTQYQNFVRQFQIQVWTLSDRIRQLDAQLGNLTSTTDRELSAAVNQIETNVETESQQFVQQQRNAEQAFRVWDTEDGLRGFRSYESIVTFVRQVLIPPYNDFLAKVPNTQRVGNAFNLAQSALNQIMAQFEAFPTFIALPPPSDDFPHTPVFAVEKQFGEQIIIDIVKRACVAHFTATGNKLAVGNMQYQHGGRMSPHVSHRRGIDADIDVLEAGTVGQANYNRAVALAAAKRFLSAGAEIVFFADNDVVTDANTWAQGQGLSGRLRLEANHTGHFHLRARP
jgi:hypothetical protein